jgi:hypothetical protein
MAGCAGLLNTPRRTVGISQYTLGAVLPLVRAWTDALTHDDGVVYWQLLKALETRGVMKLIEVAPIPRCWLSSVTRRRISTVTAHSSKGCRREQVSQSWLGHTEMKLEEGAHLPLAVYLGHGL